MIYVNKTGFILRIICIEFVYECCTRMLLPDAWANIENVSKICSKQGFPNIDAGEMAGYLAKLLPFPITLCNGRARRVPLRVG